MKEILILVDDRGFFYSSTRERGGSMDVYRIKEELKSLGYIVEIKKFYEINFSNSYENKIIIYQSTEDPGLKYKDYIEDILLGLKKVGAILIPGFDYFRAHHNKVFEEILRDVLKINEETNIYSKKYGTLEEFKEDIKNQEFPIIIKSSGGSRSRGVHKANNGKEAIKKIKRVSRTPTLTNLRRAFKNIFEKGGYKTISNFRNKFIVQNYVPGLMGGYKILVYGDRYYVLERQNRKKDFRASGSGKFSFPVDNLDRLLDFSLSLFHKFKVPFASLDIAIKNNKFYLVEFQFISFGQYTLEKSNFYFMKKNDRWLKIDGKSDLEKTFSNAIDEYIKLYI